MRHQRYQVGDQSGLIKARSQADLKLHEANQELATLKAQDEVNNEVFSKKKEFHNSLL
jgi:hypothetical protein